MRVSFSAAAAGEEAFADERWGDALDAFEAAVAKHLLVVFFRLVLLVTVGTVVSALLWNDRLLVRRTDFGDHPDPVELQVGERTVSVPRAEGKCQLFELD